MKRFSQIVFVCAIATIAGMTTAHASNHGGKMSADSAVEYRQDLMAGIGGDMATISCFLKGACKLNDKGLKRTLRGLSAMSLASIHAFEENVQGATIKTTSVPAIWEKWDQFEDGLKDMAMKAKAAEAAVGTDGFAAAIDNLGKNCKACHDNFREKK